MTSDQNIATLIAGLGSTKGSERHGARRDLVRLGSAAVPQLMAALADGTHNARWGAAKALGEIADPTAAPTLVKALEDDDSDVRWLAATALVALRRDGLVSLLEAIRGEQLDLFGHHAAHHVVSDLAKRGHAKELAPLLEAIESDSPDVHAPLVAAELLQKLRR